jgi:hypothetical protein
VTFGIIARPDRGRHSVARWSVASGVQHLGFGLEMLYKSFPNSNMACCWCKCISVSNMVSGPVDEPGRYPEPGVDALRNRIVSVALGTSNPISLLAAILHPSKNMLPVVPWPVQE